MKVMKFGGSNLRSGKDFRSVAEIIKNETDKKIIVLSGVYGVTDILQRYLHNGKYAEKSINNLISKLQTIHLKILKNAIENNDLSIEVKTNIISRLKKLERLLHGVLYLKELTDRTKDLILSYGERLSVSIMVGTLRDLEINAVGLESDNIGVITDGNYGNASAILSTVETNLKKQINQIFKEEKTPIITGFFGCNKNGDTTLFGRNGSDYSASVIGYALDADLVEIWKDVNGFMTVDPGIIKDAKTIDYLSYEEAAELAYFGAKILHPRTIDPLIKKQIPLEIKNINNPDAQGSIINGKKNIGKKPVKSIAFTTDIACIKIHGGGIGYKPGVLGEIVSNISSKKINIKSVITSQTCITLLLDKKYLQQSYNILRSEKISTVENIEKNDEIALIAIVGEGINKQYGIAARAFNVVADKKINIEMISAGASNAAYYFIINQNQINDAIKEIHREFFNS